MKFHGFLDIQLTEDRRAFLVHFPARSGKTAFFREIEETRPDIEMFDLQKWLAQSADLLDISSVGLQQLKKNLLQLDTPKDVIVVDNCDILFNTWKDRDKEEFIAWLKLELRSPSVTNKTYIFVIQTDPFFEHGELRNSRGESRILPLDAFEIG